MRQINGITSIRFFEEIRAVDICGYTTMGVRGQKDCFYVMIHIYNWCEAAR